MRTQARSLALALGLIALGPATPADVPRAQCGRAEWEKRSDDALAILEKTARGPDGRGAWAGLRDLYRSCPENARNSSAESFGWIPAFLLANHWARLDDLAPLAAKDPEWFDFTMVRLSGPIDPALLRTAAGHAELRCPRRHEALCARLRRETLKAAETIEAGMREDADREPEGGREPERAR